MCRAAVGGVAALVLLVACAEQAPESVLVETARYEAPVDLPPPDRTGTVTLEDALADRRSVREFADRPLPLETIGQLFWSGQGVTDDAGYRTAPSAGARYPLELYAVTDDTLLHYLPDGHRVERRTDRTTLDALASIAFGQRFVGEAPVVVVIAADFARTEAEYGAAAHDLVNRESGHAAQNVLLQATALDLAAVPVGGFDPAEVGERLALPPGEEVLYLIPVGEPAN